MGKPNPYLPSPARQSQSDDHDPYGFLVELSYISPSQRIILGLPLIPHPTPPPSNATAVASPPVHSSPPPPSSAPPSRPPPNPRN
ncbi:hypothetical protein Fmac_027371 [Flemingia macrophylla]|uniref:Uncharacterized protein n=1 Tax=Flemingia macrophylla TaxID=520843 RepID=A0ABD1LHH7_9FABA